MNTSTVKPSPPKYLFYVFPVLFFFFLPFGFQITSLFALLWALSAALSYKAMVRPPLSVKSLLLPLFFVLTVVSASASINGKDALSAIEVKLSFILLPWLFFCYPWPVELIKRCLIAFVSGNFIAAVLLIIRAVGYAIQGENNYFFYMDFSYFMHPSYFAMYLCFSLVLLALYYPVWFEMQPALKKMSWVYATVLTITVFLCASKMGFITLFLMVPLLLAYRFRKHLSTKSVSVMAMVGIVLLFSLPFLFPTTFDRLKSITSLEPGQIDKTSSESSAVRVLIWKQSTELIARKPLTGYGVGDANDSLYAAYSKNGLTGALEHHLNTHNQFLQSALGLGVGGFVCVLLLTLYSGIDAMRTQQYSLVALCLLLLLNYSVESMLQTASGVLFTAAFYCLLSRIPHAALMKKAIK